MRLKIVLRLLLRDNGPKGDVDMFVGGEEPPGGIKPFSSLSWVCKVLYNFFSDPALLPAQQMNSAIKY